jgi:hypothetical protein
MLVLLSLLAVASGVAWIVAFFVYHVTSATIHLLLLPFFAFGALALVLRARHRVV